MPPPGKKGGGSGGMSKAEACFEAIKTENIKTLHWSLRYGGCSATKPYDEETQLAPIHFATMHKKFKSLKCILELVDRLRDFSSIVDFRNEEQGMTPLMLAASLGWKEGAQELIRFDASLDAVDKEGRTARDHAVQNKKQAIVDMIDDWLRDDDEDDGPETEAHRRKREDKEACAARQAARATEAKAEEAANLAAKDAKYDDHDKIEEAQKTAALSSKWTEVRSALEDLSAEVRVSREASDSETGDIDPTLWQCNTLKILRLRLPKEMLTALPPQLGMLTNLTELIVSHNSLVTFPAEIGLLVNLKALEAENNCIESLPEELGNCTKLEVLNVTQNKLTSIASLTRLSGLLSILASYNELTELDFPIEANSRLSVLSVAHNKLIALPPGIGSLSHLKALDASENSLTSLPTEMGNLSEKKLLDLKLGGQKFADRKINQLIEKSVKLVKELTGHLQKQSGGGGGGGGGGKKKKK